uniref:Cytochrome P450 n=1 Tax=Brugia timori TaxID=42155 RepID=A0A0R3R8S5_9BILA
LYCENGLCLLPTGKPLVELLEALPAKFQYEPYNETRPFGQASNCKINRNNYKYL